MKFIYSKNLISYQASLDVMQDHVQRRAPLVWGLQHPHIYTAGTSANSKDILSSGLPVIQTGRGGQYTYHGPGQLVIYVVLDLRMIDQTLSWFIKNLESWGVSVCESFGVKALTHPGRVGVWIKDQKIMAIGVRVSKGMTLHGLAFNICPDLYYFSKIVPCGLHDFGVTSLKHEGINASCQDVWQIFKDVCPFNNLNDKNLKTDDDVFIN